MCLKSYYVHAYLLNIFGPTDFYKFTFLGTHIYIYVYGIITESMVSLCLCPCVKCGLRTRKYRDKETERREQKEEKWSEKMMTKSCPK